MAGRVIEKQYINLKKRKELSRIMERATCYLLEGELAKGKRHDLGQLIVFADYGNYCELIKDRAAEDGASEHVHKFVLSETAMNSLKEILAPPEKPKGGRPKKYGSAAEIKALKMQREGTSLRQIARTLGCSLSTVQGLLGKRYGKRTENKLGTVNIDRVDKN